MFWRYRPVSPEQRIVAIKAKAITNENNPSTNDVIRGTLSEDVIFAGEASDYTVFDPGNDTIHLSSSDVFVIRSIARNTTTDERISVEGMMGFSSVIDVGGDVDTIYFTDNINWDAFFLHDSYSGLHKGITAMDDGFARETAGRAISVETINAGDGDDVIALKSHPHSTWQMLT